MMTPRIDRISHRDIVSVHRPHESVRMGAEGIQTIHASTTWNPFYLLNQYSEHCARNSPLENVSTIAIDGNLFIHFPSKLM
ncbi:MAG: hypothetical protein ABII79_14580 [bacterium]